MAFLEMGGYAAFVWPAFALTLGVLGGLAVVSVRTLRSRERQLRALEGARAGRRARGRAKAAPEGVTEGAPAVATDAQP